MPYILTSSKNFSAIEDGLFISRDWFGAKSPFQKIQHAACNMNMHQLPDAILSLVFRYLGHYDLVDEVSKHWFRVKCARSTQRLLFKDCPFLMEILNYQGENVNGVDFINEHLYITSFSNKMNVFPYQGTGQVRQDSFALSPSPKPYLDGITTLNGNVIYCADFCGNRIFLCQLHPGGKTATWTQVAHIDGASGLVCSRLTSSLYITSCRDVEEGGLLKCEIGSKNPHILNLCWRVNTTLSIWNFFA